MAADSKQAVFSVDTEVAPHARRPCLVPGKHGHVAETPCMQNLEGAEPIAIVAFAEKPGDCDPKIKVGIRRRDLATGNSANSRMESVS